MVCRLIVVAVLLTISCPSGLVSAQYSGIFGLSGMPNEWPFLEQGGVQAQAPAQRPTYLSLGWRKYLNSFTSYQFPDAPGGESGTDPISRLEWPWDQSFGVIKFGSNSYGIQVTFEGAFSILYDSTLKAQDSDWEDANNPSQKTTFSDGLAMPRSWTFDTGIGYTVPSIPYVQWLLGYRAQQFRFTYTDVTQGDLFGNPSRFYPGESIHFSQYYKIWYLGAALYPQLPYNFLGKLTADVGTVKANNVDFHVNRVPGPRFTFETTNGICWHANLTLQYWYQGLASIGVAGDLMSITTNGGHRWTEPGLDMSWDGARVWSEQKYFEVNASILF